MAEVSDEQIPEEEPPVEPEQSKQEVRELDTLIEELSALIMLCEETLAVCAHLKQQEAVQRQLKQYASGLVGVARSLQHLHDLRRHIPHITELAQSTRKNLIAARGGEEDALVSEEARVLVAVEHTKQTVLESIQALEFVLSQARDATPPLLAVIGYSSPGFVQFATQALSAVRVDLVAGAIHTERERLRNLRQDIHDVYGLFDHAQSLQ